MSLRLVRSMIKLYRRFR